MSSARAEAFVRRRAGSWSRFRDEAAALARAGKVPPDRVIEFARRYREVAADLSAARGLGAPEDVVFDLNAAVSVAHGVVYRERVGPGARTRGSALRFLLHDFPAVLRRRRKLLGLAAAFLFLPAVFSFLLVYGDPHRIRSIIPNLQSVVSPETGRSINPMPLQFSTQLAIHNTLVCFLYFASGVFLGVGAAYFLALNGVMLGGLAAHFANQGAFARFWPQILPHGVTEFLAMLVAAAAGLHLAQALWRPGEWSRRDALVLAGRDAGRMLFGVAVLLAFSGVVEGMFTRSVTSDAMRNLFALCAAVAVAAWLFLGARASADQTPPDAFSER